MTRLIVSISSDIGFALAKRWIEGGYRVIGTSRKPVPEAKFPTVQCDLASRDSKTKVVEELLANSTGGKWDVLVLAAGSQEPIGKFRETEFSDWAMSLNVNLISQLELLHLLMPHSKKGSRVIMFAGGGTNGPVDYYSAYTLAKIASIKACELLASEEPELGFTILGPGWVRTKIHEQTLKAGPNAARSNYQRTIDMLAGDNMVSMEQVLDWVDWIIEQPIEVVSGRNFSAAHDPMGNQHLLRALTQDEDLFKLRRFGNATEWVGS